MHLFIDESGSAAGDFYIVAGLHIADAGMLERVIKDWRTRFYRTRKQRKSLPPNEFKDSRASCAERRFVLARISQLPVVIAAVACPQYAQHRHLPEAVVILVDTIYRKATQPLRVVIDDPGLSKKRRQTYDETIRKGLEHVAFTHTWVQSESCRGLQAADAIAGTIRRYVETPASPESIELFGSVQSHMLEPIRWLQTLPELPKETDPVRLTLTIPSLSTELQPAIASTTGGFASRSGQDRVLLRALPLRLDYMISRTVSQEPGNPGRLGGHFTPCIHCAGHHGERTYAGCLIRRVDFLTGRTRD